MAVNFRFENKIIKWNEIVNNDDNPGDNNNGSKGPFTNTCWGLMQKKSSRKFFGAPFQTSKISDPLFVDMKIMGQPHRNHINSIFPGKFVIFFKPPPPVKTFKGPTFCIRSHLTGVREWSLEDYRSPSARIFVCLVVVVVVLLNILHTLLDCCLKNYTTLWSIWTYQLLCKKNCTTCLQFYTSCVIFLTQQFVGSYVSQCCAIFFKKVV